VWNEEEESVIHSDRELKEELPRSKIYDEEEEEKQESSNSNSDE
jgi:hypothetical protein